MRLKHYLPVFHKLNPFITEWDIPYPYYPVGENFKLPLTTGYNYNFVVDWGDGSPLQHFVYSTEDVPNAVHIYTAADKYLISISGLCERFSVTYFGHPPSEREYLTRILQWGSIGLVTCASMFDGCGSLTEIPTDDMWSGISSFDRCFYDNGSLDGNAPLLWLRDPVPGGDDCFYNCLLLDNYDDIPVGWK